nr:hypothetical protein [Kibdelosporangium sp. MJ126-NF4]CEL16354.1 hypothetical protein [Kibdelosporangium sp. MJ126-NF4]CTQ94278.1 hypothetical protein [Kibdelosporangium sp. MJ126-NF4]
MRLFKMAAVVGAAVAVLIGAAGNGSAAEQDFGKPVSNGDRSLVSQGFEAQRTSGTNAFYEINAYGELNYWTRSAGSYDRQVRGNGWNNTKQITALSENLLLELKGNDNLSLWTWNGSFFTEQGVGTGWSPTRLISGIASDRFIEVKQSGTLSLWRFTGAGLQETNIGSGWQPARLIGGLTGNAGGEEIVDFIEINDSGATAEWVKNSTGFHRAEFINLNLSDVRMLAGIDVNHFVVVATGGQLVEFAYDGNAEVWNVTEVGSGWQGSRLIG